MSHIRCSSCGGREHVSGYGFAAGVLGSYTICECGRVLELVPDLDGLTSEQAKRVNESTKKILGGKP